LDSSFTVVIVQQGEHMPLVIDVSYQCEEIGGDCDSQCAIAIV